MQLETGTYEFGHQRFDTNRHKARGGFWVPRRPLPLESKPKKLKVPKT